MEQLTALQYCRTVDSMGGTYTPSQLVLSLAMSATCMARDEFYELENAREYVDEVHNQMRTHDATTEPNGWTVGGTFLRRPKVRDIMSLAPLDAKFRRQPWVWLTLISQLSDGNLRMADVESMPVGQFLAVRGLLRRHMQDALGFLA